MRHLVICGARLSRSPDVTLFLQLRKTSCKRGTDIPHMFFSFCDSVCSNCLHPFSCLAHIFHSLPLFPYLPSISSPSPFVSLPQTSLITWQWTTSPSRSSCWPLAWPRPESEVSPHLRPRCGGATWSLRSPWRLLCSCFVATDQCTPITSYPPGFNTNSVERDKLF